MADDPDFSSFIRESQRGLLRLATALTGDSSQAEDIVADVLARLCEQWRRIGRLERTNAYVRRMVVNEFLSRQRRWRRTAPHADLTAIADQSGAVSDHADAHAERVALLAQLARLPHRRRAVLVLRYYEGLSDAEIAQVMGCAVSTVRSLASRALAALRIELSSSPPSRNGGANITVAFLAEGA